MPSMSNATWPNTQPMVRVLRKPTPARCIGRWRCKYRIMASIMRSMHMLAMLIDHVVSAHSLSVSRAATRMAWRSASLFWVILASHAISNAVVFRNAGGSGGAGGHHGALPLPRSPSNSVAILH